MKRILLFVFILSVYHAKASDTLTVRQVFNFNVGDTFDYVSSATYQYFPNGNYPNSSNIYRLVITSKTFSYDSQTIYYTYNLPLSGHVDSFIYHNLDSGIVYYDTLGRPGVAIAQLQTNIDSDNRIVNIIQAGTTDYGYTNQYTQGLGLTYSLSSEGNVIDGMITSETRLFYYYQDSVGHGIPYYNLPNGVNDIAYNVSINVYPNPTNGSLHISIPDAVPISSRLILSDIIGQTVYSSLISTIESTHDISNLSPGIYTWKLIQNSSIIKTGKLVKE